MHVTAVVKSKTVFHSSFLLLVIALGIVSLLWLFTSKEAFSAEVSHSQEERAVTTSQHRQNETPVNVSRGRSFFNAALSPKIFSKRDWFFQDWVFFVVFAIASVAFLACILLMALGSPNYPEHILFPIAILSGSVALPWYLSLFALPANILKVSSGICWLTTFFSFSHLIHLYWKNKQEHKKPDIFLE
ncbi:MAG: hypothetical protein HY582_04515 [Candidatus Omnitrophica bacterium]|nr:hypothetical protein [Candidatus Omnitrophota bacterium]